MTRQEFFDYCLDTFSTEPDYPWGDSEAAVMRHFSNRKWYALIMRVPRSKFGMESSEETEVINLKLPYEMFGSFGAADGVHPAYHMNKTHWVSVLIEDAAEDVIKFLLGVSYDVTRPAVKKRNKKNEI